MARRCPIKECREGQCAACITARCAHCGADTRYIHSHEVNRVTFCGPSDSSPCRWLCFKDYAKAA
jgi:hypothetical protein